MSRRNQPTRFTRLAILLPLAAIVLLLGLRCSFVVPPGGTEVWVFNRSRGGFLVDGDSVAYWTSHWIVMGRSETKRMAITRGGVLLDTLVVTTSVPPADQDRYGVAINILEQTPGVLIAEEFSPYVEARLIAPTP